MRISTIGVIAVVLAFATVASVLPSQRAMADDRGYGDRGYGDHGYGDHGRGDRGHDRGRHSGRWHERRYPVYVPPPVYYPRDESPGISIVFPFEIRR